jgi:hypothetical protein
VANPANNSIEPETTSFGTYRTIQEQGPVPEQPFHEWTFQDGTVWTLFYRTSNGYLLRFPGLADFTISTCGKNIAAYKMPGVSLPTIEHLYQNQVLPLAQSRQFKLVLHASAVEIDHQAAVFLGASGQGKSTLAASFSTSGYRFLTDDGLRLRKETHGYVVEPSFPSIRLWDDSREALIPIATESAPPVDYSSKSRLLANEQVTHCDVARPLRCMYFLGGGETRMVSIERVSGRDAMIELVKHCFLLDIGEQEMLRYHFDQLVELARRPIFFRLDYPRQYDMLPRVREAVISHSVTI